MDTATLDDLARMIELDPARCMDAATLLRRASQELGLRLPLTRFLAELRTDTRRFRVLDDATLPHDGWSAPERACYAEALLEAGLAAPLVTLSARPPDPDLEDDVLAGTNAALTGLVAAEPDDASLGSAVSGALAELCAVRRALCAAEGYAPARRSSTLHHSASASSASTVKPAAVAAARIPSASSTRMPDRIAQPPGASER